MLVENAIKTLHPVQAAAVDFRVKAHFYLAVTDVELKRADPPTQKQRHAFPIEVFL